MSKAFVASVCAAAIIFGVGYKAIPGVSFNLGKEHFKKGQYVEAYKDFKRAYSFDATNKNYRYFYVKSIQHLSPSLNIQKEVFKIANGDKYDSAQQLAQMLVNQWRNNVLANIGQNYIEQAPMDRGIIRWDVKKFPLKVAIYNESGRSLPSYYQSVVKNAFGQWQASTKFITFKYAKDNPDIIIKIKPTPSDICEGNYCRYVVGYTTPSYRGRLLQSMTIILYTTDPNGNFFSDKELYNTTLHEIGHALGIMGHSYSSEDLMYMSTDNTSNFYTPYRSAFQQISLKDLNTIELLYRLMPDVVNTPLSEFDKKGLVYAPIILGTSEQMNNRKLKEAQNYVKQAPNLSGGYVDLGIAYAELKKYKSAIKALEKSYSLSKTNNEKYIATYNLAIVYMQNKDYNNALRYANEAKSYNYSEDVKNLIMQINHYRSKV